MTTVTRIHGQKYAVNPRRISRKQFAALKADLAELGDLSGVVHDLNSNQFIGGNQRSEAMSVNDCEIEIIQAYDAPTPQGTVAHGFVVWQGERYAYRQVRWTPEQCRKANIIANVAGGTWDGDVLANWDAGELTAWGMDAEKLKDWQANVGWLGAMVESEKPEAIGDGEIDTIPEEWDILIECDSEMHQNILLERFIEEGIKCRALLS